MPADAGIDDGGTGLFNRQSKLNDLFVAATAFNQIQHGKAVDNDKVSTDGFTHPSNGFQSKADTLVIFTPPAIIALVGACGNKLVNQIAL